MTPTTTQRGRRDASAPLDPGLRPALQQGCAVVPLLLPALPRARLRRVVSLVPVTRPGAKRAAVIVGRATPLPLGCAVAHQPAVDARQQLPPTLVQARVGAHRVQHASGP